MYIHVLAFIKRIAPDQFIYRFFSQIYKKELKSYNNHVYLVADNEITPYESASVTVSQERGIISDGSSGNNNEMGANGGAIPVKGILTVKLSKQKIQSAIPEIHPENIGVTPKKKNITLNVSEKVMQHSNSHNDDKGQSKDLITSWHKNSLHQILIVRVNYS